MSKGIDIEVTVSFSGARKKTNLWQNAMADVLQSAGYDASSIRPKKQRRPRTVNGFRRAWVGGKETVIASPVSKN